MTVAVSELTKIGEWRFACPRCHATLAPIDPGQAEMACSECDAFYRRHDGVWNLLAPERRDYFSRFLSDYTSVRLAEGRGAQPQSYFLRLPQCDPSHPMAWQWRIRSCTAKAFDREVAPRLAPGSKVLDLGAGCGWFSNHLAQRGFRPCAVDITTDAQDGLGAALHYNPDWPRVEAEFDRLPFPDRSMDAVVFNASLHYSTDYVRTLNEALRVLHPKGQIIVLESPVYKRKESGAQMSAERHQLFEKRYGTRSDSIPSIEYLTWEMIRNLGQDLDLNWNVVRPWYGWKWAIRPWVARWKRKREPSRFVILVAGRKESSRP